jgi:hypothetical protein
MNFHFYRVSQVISPCEALDNLFLVLLRKNGNSEEPLSRLLVAKP